MRHQVYCCFCLVAKSCPTLCYPVYCSSPGSSVHGISQARILEGVAISFSRGSSWPRDRTCIFSLPGRYFTLEPPRKPTWSLLEKLFFKKKKKAHCFQKCCRWPPGSHHVRSSDGTLYILMWQLFYFFLVASVLSCWPGNKPASSALEGRFLTAGSPGQSVSLEYLAWITGSKPLLLHGNSLSIMIVFDNVQDRKDFDLL